MLKLYLTIAALSLVFAVSIGIVLPFLFSAESTIAVTLGVIYLIGMLPALAYGIKKIYIMALNL